MVGCASHKYSVSDGEKASCYECTSRSSAPCRAARHYDAKTYEGSGARLEKVGSHDCFPCSVSGDSAAAHLIVVSFVLESTRQKVLAQLLRR